MNYASKQFPLDLSFSEKFDLEQFIIGPNTLLVSDVKRYLTNVVVGGRHIIWGTPSTGKTHLLCGLSQRAINSGIDAFYFSFDDAISLTPDLLQSLEQKTLLCIDDISTISDDLQWQEALFHLCNRATHTNIIFSSRKHPKSLFLQLVDLQSRLLAGTVYRLESLNEEDRLQVLKKYVAIQGMAMEHEALQYLMRHGARDLSYMLNFLSQLNKNSLVEQCSITIPFIKRYLS